MSSQDKVLRALCAHVRWNYHASLGYEEDRAVYGNAAIEYSWLLEAIGITDKEFVEYCEEQP